VKPNSIASGAVGGIYQPIAEAIAKIARETPGLDLPLTVEATGASVSNVQLLGDGKVQLALVQNDIAFYAHEGTTLPAFRAKARSNLRSIASIYPEFVQVVASKASGVIAVEGFRGKRVALGPEGSGTEQNALQLLDANGLKVTDLGAAERIDTAERKQIAVKATDVRNLRDQRSQWEAPPAQRATAIRPAPSTKTTIAAKPVAKPSRGTKPPAVVPPHEVRVTQPERVTVPNTPRTPQTAESRFIPKVPPTRPSQEQARTAPAPAPHATTQNSETRPSSTGSANKDQQR
jgi:hypothetical protein